MSGVPSRSGVLPPEPTTIRQWCPNCQRATPSLIIEGRVYCASCEPGGPDWDWDEED